MRKKSAIRTHHAPHFYAIFALLAIAVGVFGTVLITKALALNAVIYSCVSKTNGAVRIVEATTTCKSSENPLSWNQEGPAGPPGTVDKHSKALTNNTDTDLFSFPLTDGNFAIFTFSFGSKIKKGADWGSATGLVTMEFYNDGGTLQKHIKPIIYENQGPLNLNTASFPFNASISGGVVTVTANLGNVVTSPDVFSIEYLLQNYEDSTLTFLP